ncbi:unnamed protein product [Diamesa hyperborea]
MQLRFFVLTLVLSIFVNKSEAQGQNSFVECRYVQDARLGYSCLLDNIVHLNEQGTIFVVGFHMPGRNDNNVSSIRIVNSRTPFIITQLFSTFPFVTTLEIENSRLERISSGAFLQAGGLQDISITNNPITTIEANAFRNLNRLRILELNYNQINRLPETVFDGLSSLENLNLSFNRIFNVTTRTFISLTRLTTLNLGYNNLTHIAGDTFQNNRNLTTLVLRNNQIQAIQPNFVNNLSNLFLLMLRDNNCVNQNFERGSNWDLTNGLRTCYNNWNAAPVIPEPEIPVDFRKYVMYLRGELIVADDNGRIISRLNG